MKGIVFATRTEAKPLITVLEAKLITQDPFDLFSFTINSSCQGLLIISGVGRQNAQNATEFLLKNHTITDLINSGICGALKDEISIGSILTVDSVFDGDILLEGNSRQLPTSPDSQFVLPSESLATVTEPVFEPHRRSKLATRCSLVDMEGFDIVQTCREHGVPCHLVKGVSDPANHIGKKNLKENIQRVSNQLAETVMEHLCDNSQTKNPATLPEKSGLLEKLHRFTRIEHTVLSLPLLFAGAWLGAAGLPPLKTLLLIATAGIGARIFGMACNRILDRDLDALNKRTANRELPGGRLSVATAWLVAGTGLAVYLLSCAGLGRLCLFLSPVPAIFLFTYSLLKRFTNLCHFGIGMCLAMAPIGAFVACSGSLQLSEEIILLSVFTCLWISGFDIIYSIQDMDSDRKHNVHSIPASLGSFNAQVVSAFVHTMALTAITLLWWMMGREISSTLALIIAAGAFAAGYWQRLPLHVRFFPVSAIAGIAGALVPVLGRLR